MACQSKGLSLSGTAHPSIREHSLHMHGLEELLFQLCCCVSFLVLAGNRFWCYLIPTQSTIQLWRCVSFLVLAGNSCWCYIRSQNAIQLCGCVSFLVVAGNSSQKIRTPFDFLRQVSTKNSYWVTFYYDSLANVCTLKLGCFKRHALCNYFVGKYGRLFKHSTIMQLFLHRNSKFCDKSKIPPRVSWAPSNQSPTIEFSANNSIVFSANNSILSITKTTAPHY